MIRVKVDLDSFGLGTSIKRLATLAIVNSGHKRSRGGMGEGITQYRYDVSMTVDDEPGEVFCTEIWHDRSKGAVVLTSLAISKALRALEGTDHMPEGAWLGVCPNCNHLLGEVDDE